MEETIDAILGNFAMDLWESQQEIPEDIMEAVTKDFEDLFA